MVDSPVKPQQVVTSDIPQSKLSGADIAQPYEMLARGLGDLGQGVEKVAVPLAERAGAEAVTRDADGNIQVERMPVFGLAGEAYERAIKVGALSEADGAAKRADLDLRQKYHDDPQGYLVAADKFKRTQVQQISQSAGPEVGTALGRAIETNTTQTYRGLLNEKERLDLQRADGAITAQIGSASDDALALARQGVDLNDSSFQGLLNKRSRLQQERLQNPRLAYTPEQATVDNDRFESQIFGNRYLFHIDQTYKSQGLQAAERDAQDILTNPSYKVRPALAEQFYHKALGEIRAQDAVRKQDISELRSSWQEMKTSVLLGGKLDPQDVNNLRTKATSLSAFGLRAEIEAAAIRLPLVNEFGKQPAPDRAVQLSALRGTAALQGAYQYYVNQGYSPAAAAGIVGHMPVESGVDPNAVGDNGSSIGLMQWHRERAEALKAFAAARGKPATDFQTQLEFVDNELRTTEAATKKKLDAARTPEEAAHAMMDYERPQGWTAANPAGGLGYAQRVAMARKIFDGNPMSVAGGDLEGGPAATAWLLQNQQLASDGATRGEWKVILDDYAKGVYPSKDRVSGILDAAAASQNDNLLETIRSDWVRIQAVQDLGQAPRAKMQAFITELRREGTAGELSPGHGALLHDLDRADQAIATGLNENPVATAIANFPDKFRTPAPLDPSDPKQMVGGLKMRAQIAQVAAANWGTGPLSALDNADVQQLKGMLASPDPAVKAQVYSALATLPDGVRDATLKKMAGNDVNSTVEAAAGSLIASNPDVSSSIFRGMAAMKADQRYDPSKGDGKDSYQDDIDRMLPPGVFSLAGRTNPSGDYATMAAMVKARYADLAAQSGDFKYSAARLSTAVSDVTGGVLDHNGGALIAPRRGMTQAQFDRILWGLTDKDLAGVTSLTGQPVTVDRIRDKARLESVAEGLYVVLLGSDPLKPIYAMRYANTESPTPFVLDLRGRTPAVTAPPSLPEYPY